MSQLKSRPSKVQSKVSNEKLGSDHQVSKQKSKNLRRQYANSKPTRKVSPQRNGKQESTTNGVNIVEDLSNKEVAKINLKTLQKIDSGIAKILSTIPHVELYQFKSSENMWERTTYEGTLFVYSRDLSSGGGKGFVILNRLNSENTQEHIVAGMEFREQYPFLLYKRESGDIFGLCIKDEQHFKHAGERLNSPSASYEEGSPLSSSPQLVGGSQSPLLQTNGPAAATEENFGLGAAADMDFQEITSRNYLGGQCFSDDTEGSIEGAELSTPVKAEDSSRGYTNHNVGGVVDASLFQGSASSARSPPPRSSPREVPVAAVPSSAFVLLGSDRSGPWSMVEPQTRSPDSKHKPNNRNRAAQHRRPSPAKAASLEEEKGLVSQGRSTKLPVANGLPSSFHESFSYSAGPRGTALASNPAVHHNGVSPTARRNENPGESIVKKLFPSSTSSLASQSAASSSATISPAIQTLFSHGNNPQPAILSSSWSSALPSSTTLESSSHQLLVPLSRYSSNAVTPFLPSVVSVDQLEKQMSEEDSSTYPVHAVQGHSGMKTTPAVSGLVSSQGVHFQQHNSSAALVAKEAKMLSALTLSTTAPSAASGEAVQLLQPSVFSVPSTVAQPSASTSTSSHAPVLLPSSVAAITVEPPTPVSIPSKGSAEGGFPAIPPLILSPGMTARPMNDSTSARTTPATSKRTSDMPKKAISVESDSAVTAGSLSPTPADMTPSNNYSVPKRTMTAPNATTTLMSPQQFLESRHTGGSTTGEGSREDPSLATEACNILTREQLQKTLVYLIQNDETFVDKIHRAHQVIMQSSAKDQLPKYN